MKNIHSPSLNLMDSKGHKTSPGFNPFSSTKIREQSKILKV